MRFVAGLLLGAAVGVAAARFRRPRPIVTRPPLTRQLSSVSPGGRVVVDVSDAPDDPA